MQVPLRISFRNTDGSSAFEYLIRRQAARLERFYDRITGCRVMFEAPHRHHRRGRSYHVAITLDLPRRQFAIGGIGRHAAGRKNAHAAIREAFDAAVRVIEDHARNLRGDTKTHAASGSDGSAGG